MDKMITKENILIVAMVIFTLTQMNWFATKLDLANLKIELMTYAQQQQDDTVKTINERFDKLEKNHKEY